MNRLQRKQAWALTTLGGITLGWLWLGEMNPPVQPKGTSLLPQADGAMIEGIRMYTASHHIALVREGPGWFLEAPVAGPASAERVESIVVGLSTLTVEPVDEVDPDQVNIGQYRLEVDVKGEPPQSILIGRQSPVGEGRYVWLDSAIYITSEAFPAPLFNPDWFESVAEVTPVGASESLQ